MKPYLILFALLLSAAVPAHAQWFQTNYTLKGGWNAIFLHGEATHATPDQHFPNSGAAASVLEIWRWNPNPNQVQFTEAPLIPSAGTPEWSVWRRGLPAESNLSRLTGQTAYLVKCSGTAATTITVPVVQRALPPAATWVRSGANLFGFPSRLNGANYPFISTYFQAFPAALATGAKVYQYVGGDFGAGNPIEIFSAQVERLDRNKAYWFEAEVVSNFFAPLDLSLSNAAGLDFGRTGSVITARLRNTTSAAMTVTVAPVASIAAPAGQDAVRGMVPLTRREFNAATATYTETPITAAYEVLIAPRTTVELGFGINRAAMTAGASDFYASLLRLTDSGNLFDISLPAAARVSSLAGLWIGEALITNVSSEVNAVATARAVLTNGQLTGIEITSAGVGYGAVPVPVIAPPEGITAAAIASFSPADGKVRAITLTERGSGYEIAPNVTVAAPASGTPATALATVASGALTGVVITNAGSGYTAAPLITIAPPPTAAVQAVAAASLADGSVSAITLTTPGAAYFAAPVVTVAPPAVGNRATAVARVSGGILTGITVTSSGSGYTTAPVVSIAEPPARSTATAQVVVNGGGVRSIQISSPGGGYLSAPVITFPAPVPPGTTTARQLPLRVLLHIDDNQRARLLSQVFLGKLKTAPYPVGLCTLEGALKPDEKASASRFVAAHLRLDQVLGGTASHLVTPTANGTSPLLLTADSPATDATNPFTHQFHPDHAPSASPGIVRAMSFGFTTTPPAGTSATGWGSTVIGGKYTEVLTGLHRQPLTVSGTFVLRRASESGTLITTNN